MAEQTPITIVCFIFSFAEVMTDLFKYMHPRTKKPAPMLSNETYDVIMANADRLNSAIVYDRDYRYNYFGFKVTLIV